MIAEKMVKFKSKMVMQVHDELVFDVSKKESEKLLTMVVNVMESAVDLSVPLVVDVERGVSWGSVG